MGRRVGFAALAALAALAVLPTTAHADTYVANAVVAVADDAGAGGSMAMWGAHELGPVYVGGELSLTTFAADGRDLALNMNLLVGHAARLGHGWRVLVDVGAGPCEQLDVKLGLGGDSGGFEHAAWTVGAVARVGVFVDLGRALDAWWALGLTNEVRTTLDDAEGAAAAGLSLLAHL